MVKMTDYVVERIIIRRPPRRRRSRAVDLLQTRFLRRSRGSVSGTEVD